MPQLSTVTATTPAVSSVPRMTPVTASQNKRVVINACFGLRSLGSCGVHLTQLEWWRSPCLVGALVGVFVGVLAGSLAGAFVGFESVEKKI